MIDLYILISIAVFLIWFENTKTSKELGDKIAQFFSSLWEDIEKWLK